GIHTDPLTLDPGQTQGVLHIHFGAHPIASTIQATIQASVPGPVDPSMAEVHIELVPEPAAGRSPS
ncbi:MAG TPA: hypothetical protein VFC46_04320, partial [Humisphaera sp.]|nr:hypothetical protein [Humisphaera sp.]